MCSSQIQGHIASFNAKGFEPQGYMRDSDAAAQIIKQAAKKTKLRSCAKSAANQTLVAGNFARGRVAAPNS